MRPYGLRYPNTVVLGGLLSDPKNLGEARGGGVRVMVTLHNPSPAGADRGLKVVCKGVGRVAHVLAEAAEHGHLVTVEGRLRHDRFKALELQVEQVFDLTAKTNTMEDADGDPDPG